MPAPAKAGRITGRPFGATAEANSTKSISRNAETNGF